MKAALLTFIFFLLPLQLSVQAAPANEKSSTQKQAVTPVKSQAKSPGHVVRTDPKTDSKADLQSVLHQKQQKEKSVTFQSLAQMNELIQLGVPALALSLLEGEQKKRREFSADWYNYEYKRIMILSSLERWQEVIDRADWLFETAAKQQRITRKIQLWFETQQVIARLQLKQSEQALHQLQQMIWLTTPDYRDPSLPPLWRQLVIRAYLQMLNDEDARKALVKYEQDYQASSNDVDWILLQAQVLLRTHRPAQAIRLLNTITEEGAVDVEALKLIATIQDKPVSAKQIIVEMDEKLNGKVISKTERWAWSYVAYTAAKALQDQQAQIRHLESMLSINNRYPVFDESYNVTADDLWALYSEQGKSLANDHGLLFGDDVKWQKLSDSLPPEQALSLNAALVLHTSNFATKQAQHQTIVEIIEKRNNGLELINQLYLHSDHVKDVNVLPDEVRYRLVDYALSEGDYYEAATLMETLAEPPEGKSLFDWRMRKARVLILESRYQQSVDLILGTLAEMKSITHAELDRYIQVVFDFQTVQQHEKALLLFNSISMNGLNEKLKRELYFWKAESYYSLKQYDRAALNYLQSAYAVTKGEYDLWAQSSKYKAGNALVEAGIYRDAEKVFRELLEITASDTRKALINQSLQKIRLLNSAADRKSS